MKWALLAPAIVLCALFIVWPMVEIVKLSLMATNFITSEFVGLRNFARIFRDAAFLRSISNSAWYVLFTTVLRIGSALLVVLAVMDLPKRWHDGARFAFFIPSLCAGIIVAAFWRWVFHFSGPLNTLLGIEVQWFNSGLTAIPTISLICVAATLGGVVIILLASVLSIDQELYDAARVDGASPRQIKWRITVPIIMPMVWIMILMSVISAPQIFEFIWALAPAEHSATMTFQIFTTAFQAGNHGRAAAQAIVLLVLMLGLAWGKSRIAK